MDNVNNAENISNPEAQPDKSGESFNVSESPAIGSSPDPAASVKPSRSINDLQEEIDRSEEGSREGSIDVSGILGGEDDFSDKDYIEEAQEIMKRDEDDPYKEEEDHEELQIQFIKNKFGKNIKEG
jgi:hypothetical protein